jgi:hypothetical protein
MGAPSPELCNLWLARAFNAQDVEATAAMKGTDQDGKPKGMHHHGMEVHRRLPDGSWVFFMDHPFGADPEWAVKAPPHTE